MSTKATFFRFFIISCFLMIGILLSTSNVSIAQQCCPGTPNLLDNYNPDFQTPAPPGGIPPGFMTSNNYVTAPSGGGTYLIVESRNYGACAGANRQYDHTIGGTGGLFLWFDTPSSASPTNPALAWKPWDPTKPAGTQDLLNVTPNTDYIFGAWVRDLARATNCTSGGAPLVGMKINGVDVAEMDLGTIITPCCPEWYWLCVEWNSGNNNTVLLEIESRRATGFTDLGIDDVFFGPPMSTEPLLGSDTTICLGDTLILTAPNPNATNVWNGTDTSNTFPVTTPGTYTLESDNGICVLTDTIEVSLGAPPEFSLGKDTTICAGQQVTLQPDYIPAGDVDLLWNNNTTGNTYTTSVEGWVWLEMTNGCGTYRDSVMVSVSELPEISLEQEISKCLKPGDSIVIGAQVTPSNGIYTYAWSPTTYIGDPTGNTVSFSAPPGTFILKVKVTNSHGCEAEEQMNVTILNPANVSVTPEYAEINYGDEIQLIASGAVYYTWTPVLGLNNPNVNNPMAKPLETTIYTVVGTNLDGCIDSAHAEIVLEYPFEIMIPNAFTPNGDGLNDEFGIKGSGPWKLLNFYIYNRYGEEVFHTFQKDKGWNGTHRGEPADVGVYFYTISIMQPDGEYKIFTGDVTLMR